MGLLGHFPDFPRQRAHVEGSGDLLTSERIYSLWVLGREIISHDNFGGIAPILLPMLIAGLGLLFSIIGTLFVKIKQETDSVQSALNLGNWSSIILTAIAALGVTMLIEYFFAHAVGINSLVAMMLGGIAALQVSGSLLRPARKERISIAIGQAVAAVAGLSIGVLVCDYLPLPVQLSGFVLLTFAGVAVRRIGPNYVILGLVFWVGYFMAFFFKPAPSELPLLWAVQVISAAVNLLLAFALFNHRPKQNLQHSISAWRAQLTLLFNTAGKLAALPPRRTARRARLETKLLSRLFRLTEISLVVEGWLEHVSKRYPAFHPELVRSRLLYAQRAAESVFSSVGIHSADRTEPSGNYSSMKELFQALATGDTQAGRRLAEELQQDPEQAALANAVLQIITALRPQEHPHEPRIQEFLPAVSLLPNGQLPGPAGIASDIKPRGAKILQRLPLQLRQAVQATIAMAIALPLSYLISPPHFTWALIAVFVVFLGPATRGEVAVKAGLRILGTVLGIIAAVPVAWLTEGRPVLSLVIIFIACFMGHYLFNLSYAYMIFCVTIAVLQMYELMGQLDGQILELRIFETLLGGLIAILTACFVAPIRTRDVTALLRRQLADNARSLIDVLTEATEGGKLDPQQMELALRDLDDKVRRHKLAGVPHLWNPFYRPRHLALDAGLAELTADLRQIGAKLAAGESNQQVSHELKEMESLLSKLENEQS